LSKQAEMDLEGLATFPHWVRERIDITETSFSAVQKCTRSTKKK